MQFQQLGTHARAGGFLGRGELAFGQGNAAFACDDPHGFWEGDVFDLGDEAEDVARGLAAEAVVELADGVDGEGGGFFLVERAEALVVLRSGLAQADVALDHLDDVGLLLDGLGEVGHGVCIEDRLPPRREASKLCRFWDKAMFSCPCDRKIGIF